MPAVLGCEIAVTNEGIGSPKRVLAVHMAIAVASEDLILRAQVVVDARVQGILVIGNRRRKCVVVAARPAPRLSFHGYRGGQIRNRCAGDQGQKLLSDGIEASGLNNVSDIAIGLAGDLYWIGQSKGQFRKIALIHQWCRNRAGDGHAFAASEALEIAKEK